MQGMLQTCPRYRGPYLRISVFILSIAALGPAALEKAMPISHGPPRRPTQRGTYKGHVAIPQATRGLQMLDLKSVLLCDAVIIRSFRSDHTSPCFSFAYMTQFAPDVSRRAASNVHTLTSFVLRLIAR